MSWYKNLELLPLDPIFTLPKLFNADERSFKVNLGVGVYRDVDGNPVVFEAVKEAEKILASQDLDKDYLPIEGDLLLIENTIELLFGDRKVLREGAMTAIQTLGGTGALRIGGELLAAIGVKGIAISVPTWLNHQKVLHSAGLEVSNYPYYGPKGLLFQEWMASLEALPSNTVVLIQGCCHNPTGCDPTQEQWQELLELFRRRSLIPFIDIAYCGFGKDFISDAYPVRLFAASGIEMLVAFSFSKNFGLYGERLGVLAVTLSQKGLVPVVMSHLQDIARASYSEPPLHGPRIVNTILGDVALKSLWEQELHTICNRVKNMRATFAKILSIRDPDGCHSVVEQGCGFFSMMELSPTQVQWLRSEKAIYMPKNGRLNLATMKVEEIDYIIDSFLDVKKACS